MELRVLSEAPKWPQRNASRSKRDGKNLFRLNPDMREEQTLKHASLRPLGISTPNPHQKLRVRRLLITIRDLWISIPFVFGK